MVAFEGADAPQAPKMPGEEFKHTPDMRVLAFMNYMELENAGAVRCKMSRSGKNVDCVLQIRQVGRGGPSISDRAPPEPKKKIKSPDAQKAAEMDSKLMMVFCSYCTHKSAHGDTMGLNGFHKMMRECKMLDNRLSMNDADLLFAKVDAINSVGRSDQKLGFDEFKQLLGFAATKRFPKLDHASAVLLMKEDMIKNGSSMQESDEVVQQLIELPVLKVFERFDHTIKNLFAHYATLDMASADVSNWKAVKNANRTMNCDEMMMLLLNFEIVPNLITKREGQNIFRAVNMGVNADENVDDLSFPEFTEMLGRIGLVSSDRVAEKINSPSTTIMEMSSVRKYVAGCDAGAQAHFNDMIENRGKSTKKGATKVNYEKRAKMAEAARKEKEDELIAFHRAQLATARRTALDRMSTRWISDGITTDLAPGPAPVAPLSSPASAMRALKTGTPPPSRSVMRTPKPALGIDPRGGSYMMRLRPDMRSRVGNPVALQIDTRNMAHFIDMDMDTQAVLNDWKARFKPYKREGTPDVPASLADADIVSPEIERFEERLAWTMGTAGPGVPLPSKTNMNQPNTTRLWTAPTVKLPGISDRRFGTTFDRNVSVSR